MRKVSLWPPKGHSQSRVGGQGPPSLMRLVEQLRGLLVLWVVEAMQGVPHSEGWQNIERKGRKRGEIGEWRNLCD